MWKSPNLAHGRLQKALAEGSHVSSAKKRPFSALDLEDPLPVSIIISKMN